MNITLNVLGKNHTIIITNYKKKLSNQDCEKPDFVDIKIKQDDETDDETDDDDNETDDDELQALCSQIKSSFDRSRRYDIFKKMIKCCVELDRDDLVYWLYENEFDMQSDRNFDIVEILKKLI